MKLRETNHQLLTLKRTMVSQRELTMSEVERRVRAIHSITRNHTIKTIKARK
jgi:hypothetical protein